MDARDDEDELLRWIRAQQGLDTDDDDETVVMGESAQVRAHLEALLTDDESDAYDNTVVMGTARAQAFIDDDDFEEESATVVMSGPAVGRFLDELEDEDTDATDPEHDEEARWADRAHSQPTLAPPANVSHVSPAPEAEWATPIPRQRSQSDTPAPAFAPSLPEPPPDDTRQLAMVVVLCVLMAFVIAVLLSAIGVVLLA